ncbi:MAG TPA: VIT1/CCC1 transporter family protein, partial [Erythrobacter sp.]|nr:VIT1/CCC1 transporter family protein [Erythrobacter sp.]
SQPEAELDELTGIYVDRGLEPALARQVAEALTAHDVMAAHRRDELGLSEATAARPLQAAIASALTFSVGAALPLLVVLLVPVAMLTAGVVAVSLLALALLGAMGAQAGGAPLAKPVIRVVFWGALAMAVTAGVGKLVGTAVG